MKANAAAACVGVVVTLLVPAVGNYYMSDALTGGGSVGWTYVGLAAADVVLGHGHGTRKMTPIAKPKTRPHRKRSVLVIVGSVPGEPAGSVGPA